MQATPYCSWFALTILSCLPGCGKPVDSSQALHKDPQSNGTLKVESTESKFSKNNIERFCQKIESEHPGATEPFLLDFLRLMEAGSFEDILVFRNALSKTQSTGTLQAEILRALTRKEPKRAFELTYAENDSLFSVTDTWEVISKPQDFGAILTFMLQPKFEPEKTLAGVTSFAHTYSQRDPQSLIQQLKGLREHPLFDAIVKETTWTLTWNSPGETLALIERISNPQVQEDAIAIYGAGILRRANTPQWKDEIYTLQGISNPKLRSAAFAGAYGSMLEKDFQGAIKIIENIQDQGAYDKIITDNLLLLDKKMKRDEVWALVYKVQDPAAKAKLEELTGLNLSQRK